MPLKAPRSKTTDGEALEDARRIMIMGPPGSGKSTLARHLGAKMGLPVFHLDQAFHRAGWQPVSDQEFRAEVDRIAAGSAWIIDGNYTGTIASRFSVADLVVYLDMPTWLTMGRIFKRILGSYGRVRPDAAPGCPERLNGPFLLFACNWNRLRRSRILTLLGSFPGRVVILRHRDTDRIVGVEEQSG